MDKSVIAAQSGKRAGQSIGNSDSRIAVHAQELGHTLVTDYERNFSRVVDFQIENWLL
jgi:predicted nucleic acid-binding protein